MNMLRSPVFECVMALSSFLKFAPKIAALARLMPPLMGSRLAAECGGLLVDALLALVALVPPGLLLKSRRSDEVMGARDWLVLHLRGLGSGGSPSQRGLR